MGKDRKRKSVQARMDETRNTSEYWQERFKVRLKIAEEDLGTARACINKLVETAEGLSAIIHNLEAKGAKLGDGDEANWSDATMAIQDARELLEEGPQLGMKDCHHYEPGDPSPCANESCPDKARCEEQRKQEEDSE